MPPPLATIFELPKSVALFLPWDEDDPDRVVWTSALDVGGVTYEGLRVRIVGRKFAPEAAVTIQLEYRPLGQKGGPLDRIDWRPLHDHQNKGRGPVELRFVKLIGSHHHRFHLNLAEGGGSMFGKNLPIAAPMQQEPGDFESLLDFAADHLNIANLRDVPPPAWESSLIFG